MVVMVAGGKVPEEGIDRVCLGDADSWDREVG